MPTFQYKAIDNRTGQIVKNVVSGIPDKQDLYNKLKNNGFTPIDINTTFEITSNKDTINRKIKDLEAIVDFTQNLLILKKAGADDSEALKTIINQEENILLKSILKEMLQSVESGEYIYNTMEKYTKVFPSTYVNMIKMGELSNTQVMSLEQALKYILKENKRNKEITNVIKPKITQLIGIILIFIIGISTIIPCIQNMCNELDSHINLPWITAQMSKIIGTWYCPVIITLIGAIIITIYIKKYATQYNSSIFGKLNYTIDFYKVMTSVQIEMKNGMKIHEALEESKKSIENTTMLNIINSAIENCGNTNKSWTLPFRQAEYGSSILAEMLKLGEQTEIIPQMEKIIEMTEKDIDNTLNKISKILSNIIFISIVTVLIFFIATVLIPSIGIYIEAMNFIK